MNNPLTNIIDGNSPMQNVQQIINMMKSTNNPQQMINTLAQSNPQIKQAIDMCNGKNPQEVFNNLCKQNGKNPQNVVDNVYKY